jgi:hypothetical protein
MEMSSLPQARSGKDLQRNSPRPENLDQRRMIQIERRQAYISGEIITVMMAHRLTISEHPG